MEAARIVAIAKDEIAHAQDHVNACLCLEAAEYLLGEGHDIGAKRQALRSLSYSLLGVDYIASPNLESAQ